MEHEETTQPLTMPMISRMDCLDLMEKQSPSGSYSCGPVAPTRHAFCYGLQHKPLISVLEGVNSKGSLLERVAMLENRVLQLSLEIEKERMNSHRFSVPGNSKCPSPVKQMGKVSESIKKDGQGLPEEKQEGERSLLSQKYKRNKCRAHRFTHYRKWLSWIHTGC